MPQFALTVRERDNSLMDQYTNTVTTNDQGVYDIQEGYPLSKWLVLEAFNTRYRTTGVTYQADNEDSHDDPGRPRGHQLPARHRPLRAIDWGVEPYARTRTAASPRRSPTTRPATSSTPPTRSARPTSPASPT